MGSIEIVVSPAKTSLVPLVDFKVELGIFGAGDDAVLQMLLDQASSRIEIMLGRPLIRAQYKQTLAGTGRPRLLLGVRPIASLDAVLYQSSSQSLTDYEIDSREAGFLYRPSGTFSSQDDPNAWEITTTAGYFVADDDLSGSVSVASADNSYNSTALFKVHSKPGDLITAAGFTNSANNGLRRVVTTTTSKITVNETLVTEAAATRAITFSNLPGGIYRAVVMLARESYTTRATGNSGIIEESISGASTIRWASSSSSSSGISAAEQSAQALLFPFQDF
jgi:hypothetical protein